MNEVTILFPHQLFRDNPAVAKGRSIYLVEEYLYFRQYTFHKAKLHFHRATMKAHADWLTTCGFEVQYIDTEDPRSDIRLLVDDLSQGGVTKIFYIDPVDQWLDQRLVSRARQHSVQLESHETPMFLSSEMEIQEWFKGRKRYFHNNFYIQQRKSLGILLEGADSPSGGQWSFDADNRKRYPKAKLPPHVDFPPNRAQSKFVADEMENLFANNPGVLDPERSFPLTHDQARQWLDQFLEDRFMEFGAYEDAIVDRQSFLHHSLLSPLLNVGLLTPGEVVARALEFAGEHDVPMNSLEGFVRQVIGWREFIRGVYVAAGSRQRTTNFWNFKRKIPPAFWTGTTGIYPVDSVIQKVLHTGYAHHIERLMVLGNFMLLCEFDPHEVYRWFMELFVDAYDWVMVPNIYGMSQYADGGLMTTKPYLSGSNYLMKMSDYPKGEWQQTWDALFWRFIDSHREFFVNNHRSSMMVRNLDKMDPLKRTHLLEKAESYLKMLDRQI